MKLRNKILGGVAIFLVVSMSSLALVLSHNSACEPAPGLPDDTETMQAVVYRCYGSSEMLRLEDVAMPVPADNEVLVKVRPASVNPLDWHYMRGSPYVMRLSSGIGAPANPRLGVDYSGTITAVGSKVTRFKAGDEVFGGRTGAFAEYLVAREDRAIVIKPANVSFEQAAAVPIAAVTALQALRDSGRIQAGQKVLINGASGGVGTFAVQIAKHYGAEVHGVCSTRNVDMVRSLGADHVFDYTKENYTESGNQYDLIIDNVGNHSPAKNRGILKPDGTLVLVGGPKGNWFRPFVNVIKALVLSPFADQRLGMMLAELSQDDLGLLAELMQSGAVTPVIDSRFPLHEIAAAVSHSEDGHARGKIIVNMP
jgi:NADPH:quinone reductase-like Zn-dependent oxidoreductase